MGEKNLFLSPSPGQNEKRTLIVSFPRPLTAPPLPARFRGTSPRGRSHAVRRSVSIGQLHVDPASMQTGRVASDQSRVTLHSLAGRSGAKSFRSVVRSSSSGGRAAPSI